MSATLTASALNAAYSASPADFDLLRAANTTKASPAMIPIEPPNAAEIAPCIPASQADNKLAVAVHRTCSPIIGRNTCHTLHPAAAKLRAVLGESAQDLEVRLHAQLLVGGGLDAEVRDGVPLRVRLVVLGLPDRDDPVAQCAAGGKRHQMLIRAQAQVAPRRDAVGAGVHEELRPLLEPAAVEAFGVTRVEFLDVEPQLGGQYGLFRDGHGPSDLFDASKRCRAIRHGPLQAYAAAIRMSLSPIPWT